MDSFPVQGVFLLDASSECDIINLFKKKMLSVQYVIITMILYCKSFLQSRKAVYYSLDLCISFIPDWCAQARGVEKNARGVN